MAVWHYLNTIAGKTEGNDFWVAGQPFFISFAQVDEEERELKLNDWSPQSSVVYCAMCNDQASHILLAMFAIKTAELLKGMIVLEGLQNLTSNPAVLSLSGHVKTDYGYIVEPAFLAYWLAEPEFRLLK